MGGVSRKSPVGSIPPTRACSLLAQRNNGLSLKSAMFYSTAIHTVDFLRDIIIDVERAERT